jgi:hypothetical protein
MLAGALSTTDRYWVGDSLWADEFNKKGYFEDTRVHDINEAVLGTCMPSPLVTLGKGAEPTHQAPDDERWLGLLEPWRSPLVQQNHEKMIADYLGQCPNGKPFVLKDPRFSYSLSAWMPQLTNTTYICMFRDPLSTANSIVKMCSNFAHFQPMNVDMAYALALWECMNRRIIDNLSRNGDWLFVHAHQILNSHDRQRIEKRIGGSLNHRFLDIDMMGQASNTSLPSNIKKLYLELCQLAEYCP